MASVRAAQYMQVTAMGQQVYMGHVSSKWTVLALDMTAMLMAEGDTPYKAIARLQFCANLRVRGAYTSHLKCALAVATNPFHSLTAGATSHRRSHADIRWEAFLGICS